MEIILVLLIVAVLNGAVAYIDEMLQELVPISRNFTIPITGGCWSRQVRDILHSLSFRGMNTVPITEEHILHRSGSRTGTIPYMHRSLTHGHQRGCCRCT